MTARDTRSHQDETRLTRMEETRQAAMEMAQEEDAPPEAGAEDA
jgi:hypothetical protein